MSNLLDYIRSIVDKNPIELDKGYSQYALNVYFSKFKNCIYLINVLSKCKLTDKQHYDYLMSAIPRGWQKKIEFNKNTEAKQKDIEIIKEHYKINDILAKEYLLLIDSEELKELREDYNV